MAINRDQIVKKVYNNTKTPATDFTSPLVPEYVKKLEKNGDNLKYNASKAKELWKKANAIKPWSGNFRIAYNADGGHKEWVDAVCNQIKNTLDIDAAGEPYATFSDVRNQVTNRTIKTAFRAGWMLDYPSAEDYLNPLYASSSADGHGSNDGDYKSAEFDELLNAALAQTDVKKRTEDFTKAQEVLASTLLSPVTQVAFNLKKGSLPVRGDVDLAAANDCMKKGLEIVAQGNALTSTDQLLSPDSQSQKQDLMTEFFSSTSMTPEAAQERFAEIISSAD